MLITVPDVQKANLILKLYFGVVNVSMTKMLVFPDSRDFRDIHNSFGT